MPLISFYLFSPYFDKDIYGQDSKFGLVHAIIIPFLLNYFLKNDKWVSYRIYSLLFVFIIQDILPKIHKSLDIKYNINKFSNSIDFINVIVFVMILRKMKLDKLYISELIK